MTKEYIKKEYVSPFAELEWFDIECVISTSGGQGRFDEDMDSVGSGLDSITDAVDSFIVDTNTNEVKALMDDEGNTADPDIIDSEY